MSIIAESLAKMLTKARAPYTPGVPMDPNVDQKILVGLIDGLLSGEANSVDCKPYADGVAAGREIRKMIGK